MNVVESAPPGANAVIVPPGGRIVTPPMVSARVTLFRVTLPVFVTVKA